MTACPRTWFSTEFHTGKWLLRARLRDLFSAPRRRGTLSLLLALVLTLAAGSLAACIPEQPPIEAMPEPDQAETAEDGALLAASYSLSGLEPYVPTSTWTPDTVPAHAMGEILAETELLSGQQVVCYREPGSEATKYWAIRQGDQLLRFAVEDSAYAGGYAAYDFSERFGLSGFVIEAPRGAAYTARDYYIFDENGIPRLLADCAQPVYTSDLDGDGAADLLWFYHGGREARCYLTWEDAVYQVDLLDCVRKALPDWRAPGGWETPTFSTRGLFYDEATGLAFLGEADGVTRFGYLRFSPGRVEVYALPAETEPDWLTETEQGRAGLLTVGKQTWVLTEDGDGAHLAEILYGLTEATLQPFTHILGADGYALDHRDDGGIYRTYFDTAGTPLALSFGWDRADYPIDLDGDGIRELVCNVTHMADGVPSVLVYRRMGGEVQEAYPSAIPNELRQRPANGPVWSRYDPESNTVSTSIQFLGEEVRQSFTARLDPDALEFYPWQL